MKKTFLIVLFFLGISVLDAYELTYSDWSEDYPAGIDEIAIEKEDRYLWYKNEIYDEEYLIKEEIGDKLYDVDDYKYFVSEKLLDKPKEYSERIIETISEHIIYTQKDINGIIINKIDGISVYEVVIRDRYNNLIMDHMVNSNENVLVHFDNNYNAEDLVVFIFYESFLEGSKILTMNLISDSEDIIYYKEYDIRGYKKDCIISYYGGLISNFEHEKIYYQYKDKLYNTYRIRKKYEKEYYANLEGYEKDENSIKTFYRYLTNEYIFTDYNNTIIKDSRYCDKHMCRLVYLTKKEEKIISNPKTYDEIYNYIILLIICLILIVRKCRTNKSSSIVESI